MGKLRKLGFREVDEGFDYDKARNLYKEPKRFYTTFLDIAKTHTIPPPFPYALKRKPLSPCQRKAFELVQNVVKETIRKDYKFLVLTGAAGVGKSNLWMSTCAYMLQKKVPFIVVSPIASSCADIGGITIHSFIGVHMVKASLDHQVKQPFFGKIKERIRKTKVICIDEIFLCGAHLLFLLIRRVWNAKSRSPPNNLDINNLPCSFIVCGDPFQNHCPVAVSLCSPIKEEYDEATKSALSIFKNAHYEFELKTNMRQVNDKTFQDLLIHIRENKVTDSDIALLETRLDSNLPDTELDRFLHAPHIFSSNFLATKWTEAYLCTQNIPIKRVPAILKPPCMYCEQEYQVAFLGEGVKVSVSRNLCQPANICNGTRAVVRNLYYERDADIQPLFITLDIKKGYSGPRLIDGSVPVGRVTDTGYCSHFARRYKVTFIPIRSDSGLTCFRAQSQTLPLVVCSFTGFKFRDRALYTMLSRCVALNNLLITTDKPLREYFIQ